MNNFDVSKLEWTREPEIFPYPLAELRSTTNPHTDLWQRTYYRFRNDSARFCRWRRKRRTSLLQ